MPAPAPGLIFLILAHNEELVLQRSLGALTGQLGADDRVQIVADRCSDRTAALARTQGADVFLRNEPAPPGKGAALRWWVEHQHLDAQQPVIILDADSIVQPGFALNIRSAFRDPEIAAVQTALNPVSALHSPMSAVISLSERIDQGFFDTLRYRLGGSVRLRGTGMGFRFGLLQSCIPGLETNVEDLELTLLLAARGVRIHALSSAILDDPKPDDPELAARQRARWFQGQIQAILAHQRSTLRILFRGPLAWSLMHSLMTKPRILFFPLKTLAIALLLIWSVRAAMLPAAGMLAALLAAHLAVECAALAYALFMVKDKGAGRLALKGFPGFVWMWATGIALAARRQPEWLRGRVLRLIRPANESIRQSQ